MPKETSSLAEFSDWSRPYYGITHRSHRGRRVQLTVIDHSNFAEAYWLNLNSCTPFTRVEDRIFRGPNRVAEAKHWLEQIHG